MKPLQNGVLAGLLACTATLAAAPVVAETYIVAVGAASNSLQGRSAAKFAEDLQAKLGDADTVEFYADGQLGDEKELMQKLRLGTVQFTLISSIMTNVAPEFALFDMPFLVKDRAHLKAIDAEIVQPELAPRPRRRASTFCRPGKMASARSPTTPVRSTSPRILPA
ncbi:MAG: TRAP transporter substrate-binding protein DctP [Defluviimonas denitrificans]